MVKGGEGLKVKTPFSLSFDFFILFSPEGRAVAQW